jgi:hypothetical protein
LESSCGQRFAPEGRAHGCRAGRPAAARQGLAGSPVSRFGVGLLGGHGRAVGPAGGDAPRPPVLRRIVPTSAGVASAIPTVERPRTVALASPAAVASNREPRASSTACSEVGSAAVGRSHSGGRRSVIGVEHFLARSRGGDVALSPSPPSSFGREHGRRLRWRASPLRPGLGHFAQPELVA